MSSFNDIAEKSKREYSLPVLARFYCFTSKDVSSEFYRAFIHGGFIYF